MQALLKHHFLTWTFPAYLETVSLPITVAHTPRQTLCTENARDLMLPPPPSSKMLPSFCSASQADSSHGFSGIFKSDVARAGMPLGMRPSHCHAVAYVQAFQRAVWKASSTSITSIPSAHVPGPCCQGTAPVVMFTAPPWVCVSTSIDALGMATSEVRGIPAMCGTGEAYALLLSHNPLPIGEMLRRKMAEIQPDISLCVTASHHKSSRPRPPL